MYIQIMNYKFETTGTLYLNGEPIMEIPFEDVAPAKQSNKDEPPISSSVIGAMHHNRTFEFTIDADSLKFFKGKKSSYSEYSKYQSLGVPMNFFYKQCRTHRKKRINKKWAKKYGYEMR